MHSEFLCVSLIHEKIQKVKEAQKDFADRKSEFEILRVQELATGASSSPDSISRDSTRHGSPPIQEDPAATRHHSPVASVDGEDLGSLGASYSTGDDADQGQPREDRGADGHGRGVGVRLGFYGGIQLGQQEPTSQGDEQLQQGEQFSLPTGAGELGGSGSFDAPRGSRSRSSSSTSPGIPQATQGDCRSTQVHVPSTAVLPTVSVTEGGSKLPSSILEVQSAEAVPVRILPVAESPASVEVSQVGWSAARQDLRQRPRRRLWRPVDKSAFTRSPTWRRSGPAEEDHQQDQGHGDDGVRAVPGLEAIPGGASRSLEASRVSVNDSDKMPDGNYEQEGEEAPEAGTGLSTTS